MIRWVSELGKLSQATVEVLNGDVAALWEAAFLLLPTLHRVGKNMAYVPSPAVLHLVSWS